MKDLQKNLLVMAIIVIIAVIVSDFFKFSAGYFWVSILFPITIWLIITPYKLYNDVP